MFPQENVSVSSNVKITPGTSLGVTGRKEKGLIVKVFALDFLYTGLVFVLINNIFDRVWFILWFRWVRLFEQSQGWCCGLKINTKLSRATLISFEMWFSLSGSVMLPKVFIPLFE